jgi:hypothetical protein
MEHFLVGTPFQDMYNFYLTRGEKKMILEFTESHHLVDLLTNGLKFFSFCAEDTSIVSSLMQTSSLFAGGFGFSKYLPIVGSKVPGPMKAANLHFLSKFMSLTPLQKRVIAEVEVEDDLIGSGDLFLARRLDGMDPFYMVSSGSQAAHASVALRDEHGVLWVAEAQAAYYFKNGEAGVQKTRYADWLQAARDADMEVVWIQLSKEKREAFNETLAREFLSDTLGAPYSHRV